VALGGWDLLLARLLHRRFPPAPEEDPGAEEHETEDLAPPWSTAEGNGHAVPSGSAPGVQLLSTPNGGQQGRREER
jgi:hypothetical protein